MQEDRAKKFENGVLLSFGSHSVNVLLDAYLPQIYCHNLHPLMPQFAADDLCRACASCFRCEGVNALPDGPPAAGAFQPVSAYNGFARTDGAARASGSNPPFCTVHHKYSAGRYNTYPPKSITHPCQFMCGLQDFALFYRHDWNIAAALAFDLRSFEHDMVITVCITGLELDGFFPQQSKRRLQAQTATRVVGACHAMPLWG